MDSDLKTLWQRERKRREALWKLEYLPPYSEEAQQLLAVLNDIDRENLENPIGDACATSIEELRDLVPETPLTGSDGYPFVIVLDHHIPQPWMMRFEAASALSTRLREGFYASDWRRFMRLWVREMEHLAAHRNGDFND